jgi:hypothetical protein
MLRQFATRSAVGGLVALSLIGPAFSDPDTPAAPVPIPPLPLSWFQLVLTLSALAACIGCIWMVFIFGRRLQISAYLRDYLMTGARQEELEILLRQLNERARTGPLDVKEPPPDGFGLTAQLWPGGSVVAVPYTVRLSDEAAPPDESADQKAERKRKLDACQAWEVAERARYKDACDKAETEAESRAAKKIPQSIDASLLGGGWGFLLEFSTVIVIIFALVVLGISQIVPGKDISTILAAVAGYVLGKASAAAQKDQGKA